MMIATGATCRSTNLLKDAGGFDPRPTAEIHMLLLAARRHDCRSVQLVAM